MEAEKLALLRLKSHNFSETYFNKVETSGVALKIELKSKMVDLLLWQQKTSKHLTLNSTKPYLTASFSRAKEILK